LLKSAALAVAAAAPPVGYLAIVLAGSALTGRGLGAEASRWYPVVLATIHLSWGTGFLLAAADDLTRERRRRVAGWWAKQDGLRTGVAKLRAMLAAGSS
jgi:hypothetical protein